jgi:hypothetical protein
VPKVIHAGHQHDHPRRRWSPIRCAPDAHLRPIARATGLVVIADRRERHHGHLGAGGAPEAGEQILHLRARGGVDHGREVVDVAHGLGREKPFDLRGLRQRGRRRQL